MPPPTSPDLTVRTQIWTHVQRSLRRHAVPDSRFDTDFLHFTPDFRGSDAAVARLASLACYQSATTVLVTPDNCLEGFRLRALRDGKTVVVGTYRLRRGFVVLDPARVGEARWEVASCLDGMERVGRKVGVAELMEGRVKVGLCVFGGLAFNRDGVVVWEGSGLFEVQWALMNDIGLLTAETPVVAMAHGCQVVDEEEMGVEKIVADRVGEVQCDFVVTPEKVFDIEDAMKPKVRLNFDTVDQEAMDSISPLQELRGIRMMEGIMKNGGFMEEKEKEKPRVPTAEEQMGIDMVEKLMKGYKA